MRRSLVRHRSPLAGVALSLLLAACQTPVPTPTPSRPPTAAPRVAYTPAAWTALPGWSTDTVEAAWPAFRIGCRALLANVRTQAIWNGPCIAAESVDVTRAGAAREFFENHFSAYRISDAGDGTDTGLVTGYYEPLLAGSRTRTPPYLVPLFAPPDDLVTVDLAALYPELKDQRVRGRLDGRRVVPYWPRADIARGALPVTGKVLAYVVDPVEAFFLEIQGSGRIALTDGSVIRLGYADQNGHPYRSIGRVLIDRGELPLERASMQGIAAWGRANPDQLRALLDENPSYVFFRETAAPLAGSLDAQIDGPIGSLGVPLLAGRAIAVDTRAIPLGAPIFLATTMPLSNQPLQRLTLAQDTGGAIRGAVRADFFWGFGPEAGREAGRMRQQGGMWLLWPTGKPLPGS